MARVRKKAEPGVGHNSKPEEWRPILGHGDFEVSSAGRVRCVAVRRYLKPGDLVSTWSAPSGYAYVSLDRKTRLVHRVLCAAFHGPPPTPKHEAAHNNGKRSDNRPENVRWATRVENCADIKIHGTENPPRGEMQGGSVLTEEQVKAALRRTLAGESHRSVAESFGVARTTISAISGNKTWKHVRL